jgi:hypothetical protein
MKVAVEMSLALAVENGERLVVIPREVAPWRPWRRRGGWRAVAADAAVAVLAAAPDAVLVLARPPDADPGASCVAPVARLLGRQVMWLPPGPDAAVWVVAAAAEWAASRLPALPRAIAVACGHPALRRLAPGQDLGTREEAAPALPLRLLGRLASRRWRPCARCRPGGGIPGGPCVCCGAEVLGEEAPTGPLAPVIRLHRAA